MTTDTPPEYTELVPLLARCNALITALVKAGYRVDCDVDTSMHSFAYGTIPKLTVEVYREMKLPRVDAGKAG